MYRYAVGGYSKKKLHIKTVDTPLIGDKVFGRKRIITKLNNLLIKGEKIINLYGVLGIGKSTVCYEVIRVLDDRKYATCTINARGCLSYEMLISKFLDAFGCVYSKFSKNSLFYKINDNLRYKKMVIYIDNFEDCLDDSRILDFIYELASINVQILLSTRCVVEGVKNILLKSLDAENSMKLFTSIVNQHGGLSIKNEHKLLKFIEEQLDRHTYSIKLVASKAYLYSDEVELIEAWNRSKKVFLKDITYKNDSLSFSVYNSYKQISNNDLAIFIWTCFALFPKELDYNIFNSIFYRNLYDAKMAVQLLIKHSMIEQTSKGYYMLQPIRDVISDYVKISDVRFCGKDSVETIIAYFLDVNCDLSTLFPIVCYMLMFLIRSNQYLDHKVCIMALIEKSERMYKKFAYLALPLVETISQQILPYNSDFTKEKIFTQLADLYHIVGDNKKALLYYKEAYDIINLNSPEEAIKNLRKQCEIYRLFSERKSALDLIELAYELAYKTMNYNEIVGVMWQKSEVYRLIDKNYDLALKTLLDLCEEKNFVDCPKMCDVFWSIGEIYQKKRKKRLAREYIKKSIKGFIENDNNLGLGYAYLSLANINKKLKNSDSLSLCEKARTIFDNIGYDLGRAHTFLWESKFFLKSDSEIALKKLNHALEAYSKAGYKSGVEETTDLIAKVYLG